MGRPKMNDDKRRRNVCKIRFTNTETLHLMVLKKRAKKSISEFIRDAITYYADKKYDIPKFGAEENEYWKHLVKHVLDE